MTTVYDLAPVVCGEDVRFCHASFDTLQGAARRPHHATDIFAAEGSHVHAPSAGVILPQIANNVLGGNHVVMAGDDGRRRYFAHLRDRPLVSPGDRVAEGALLGLVGHTGNTRVDHCHYSRHVIDGPAENAYADLASQTSYLVGAPPELDRGCYHGAIRCPFDGAVIRPDEDRPIEEELASAPVRRRRRPGGEDEVRIELGGGSVLVVSLAVAKLLGLLS